MTQVAEMFGVSTQTVRRWIDNASIRAYHLGKQWFIPRDELRDTLERGANIGGVEIDAHGDEED